MADVKDNEDKLENPWEKNKRLKRKKIHQKCLSKAKKKTRLEAKEVDNNKKTGNNENAGNNKM